MKKLLLLSALCFSFAFAAHAEDSLFQREKARKLTPEQQSMFGPKSNSRSYDPRMIRAAEIAKKRAKPKMTWHCWAYVKDALLAANLVSDRPTTAWARQAGDELSHRYGFQKLRTLNPYAAPVGAVIVYGGQDAGHVELRSSTGFVSDFISDHPYPRPVIGIYVKPA